MRVLLIAATTGYQTRMFGEAAERLGVRLVFATDCCDQLDDPWWDGAIPIRFHQEDAAVEAIVAAHQDSTLAGIVAVGDRPAVIAALAAERLGVPWHSASGARAAHDKRLSRRRLQEAGLWGPPAITLSLDSAASSLPPPLQYPVVVKPAALSGSRGVIRADDDQQFRAAVERLRRLLTRSDLRATRDTGLDVIIVEEYVDGAEYAIDALVDRGTCRALAVFEKPVPLVGPFFEETMYVTPPRCRPSTRDAILESVARAAAALGLSHGPIHAECRVNARGVFVLEVAARPIGGLCAAAVRLVDRSGCPVVLEELLLRHAIGQETEGVVPAPVASGVMMIPIPAAGVFRRADGVDVARQVPGVVDLRVTAKPDQRLEPLPEGASYLGFIFAVGDTSADVIESLETAHLALRFTIDRPVTVLDRASRV